MRKIRTTAVVLAALALSLIATACHTHASPTSDTMACVYSDKEHGQRLKFQLPPGAEQKGTGHGDQVIYLPASNRFYMASEDNSIRDSLAPHYYEGFARGNVAIRVEGQIRFRFNLAKACDWYAKHGRRNADADGDLGFNARGLTAQRQAGWFRILAENFGVTMQEVVSERSNIYAWPALVFNYATNADEAGVVSDRAVPGQPTRIAYGLDLGKRFTERLRENLGDDYFCGISSPQGCPDMEFQVIKVYTTDAKLTAERQENETLRQELENEAQQSALRGRNQQAAIDNAKAEQELLKAQVETARLKALADEDVQKCLLYARRGLDCQGDRPDIILGGNR